MGKGYDIGGFLDSDPIGGNQPFTPTTFGRQLVAAADASAVLGLLGISGVSIPSQTGHNGQFLTTDGATLSWGTVAAGGTWGSITGTLSSQSDLNTALGNKQPLDSDLTAIAALTTTSFGRSLLTQADAAATRSTIGAGTSSFSGLFTGLDFTGSNLTSIATRNFSDLQNIPTTFAGYGIIDTSANLASALSDEVGYSTGAKAVFNHGPQIFDNAGTAKLAIDFATRKLYDVDGITQVLDWNASANGGVYFGTTSIVGSTLKDYDTGAVAVDLLNRQLVVSDGTPAIEWGVDGGVKFNADLIDSNGSYFMSPADNFLYDLTSGGASQVASIDWNNRYLYAAGGTTVVLDWHDPTKVQLETNVALAFAGTGAATTRTNLGLTSLATTTPAAGVGTFLATPSSANLRGALSDENGTGAALFNSFTGATGNFAQTGLSINGATSNALTIKPNETLSAPRTLNLVTGNADRTITLSGNPTLNDWFDQSVKTVSTPTFHAIEIDLEDPPTVPVNTDMKLVGNADGFPTFIDGSGESITFEYASGQQVGLAAPPNSGTIALTTANPSLGIRDTSAAFDVVLAATSSAALTADRTLTLNMGNVAHTLAFGNVANTITFPNAASGTVPFLNLAQSWTADQTFGSSHLLATSPKITTGILDANGNPMLAFTATASAVDGFTFTNAATANPATVTMAATGSDSNINIALAPKGTGKVDVGSTQLKAGTVALQILTKPNAPTITPNGTTGSTTWTYNIVAKQADGTPTEGSSNGSTATGNATLTSGNFNAISWSAVTGAASYDIYRTVVGTSPTTTGKIGTTTTTSFNDTGLAGDSVAVPANYTGAIAGVLRVGASGTTGRIDLATGSATQGFTTQYSSIFSAGGSGIIFDIGQSSGASGQMFLTRNGGNILSLGSGYAFGWSSGTTAAGLTGNDTTMTRVSAGIMAHRGLLTTDFSQVQAGTIALQSLASPTTAITIANQGSAGSTSYSYKYTFEQADGTSTDAGGSATTATGNATLNGTNFNRLTLPALPTGASRIGVYRTASGGTPSTTGKIGTATTTTFDDTGLAGSGSVPSANMTGSLFGTVDTAAATATTIKRFDYIQLDTPGWGDGTNATRITTDGANYGHFTFSNSVAKASNYIIYRFRVPDNLNTAVDLAAAFTFRLTAGDTGKHSYYISMADVAASAGADAPTFSNEVAMSFAGDASGAANDIEQVGYTTLTSWKSSLTPGHIMLVKIARDGNDGTLDTSTVNSTDVNLAIRYAISSTSSQ